MGNYSDMYSDGRYLSKNPTWDAEDAPYKSSFIIQLLQKNNIPLQKIAEVGCGSGAILLQLQKNLTQSIQYFGYDISADAYKICKQNENEYLHFFHQDYTNIQNEAPYDAQLVIDVIEHVEDYFLFLKKIKNKAKYTVFHIPLDMCIWTLFREKMLIEAKDRIGHINIFTEQFILSILKDSGYTIIDKIFTKPLPNNRTLKEKIITATRNFLFALSPSFCAKTIGALSIMVLAKNESNK